MTCDAFSIQRQIPAMMTAEVVSEHRCPRCAGPVGSRDRYCEECGTRVTYQRDRVEVDVGVAAGVSDRGRRHHRNEDALALRGLGCRGTA